MNNIKTSHHKNPVWIVIVNYNSQELICKCINSLKRHITEPFNVVVVDNSVPTAKSLIVNTHNDTTIINANKNGGFASGCNLGINHCLQNNAEFILLLNPDTYVEQDFIKTLVKALEDDSKLGMVGPTIYFDKPKNKLWMAGTKVNWWTGGPKHIYDDQLLKKNKIITVPFLSGCAMMLRSSAIKDVGLMDEKYFLYFEDADYCQAFLSKKWGIAYVPSAKVIHAASSTTGFQSESYVYYFSRNRIWFLYKWAPLSAFIYYFLFTFIIKIPGSIIVFTLLKQKPSLTYAFFKGFICGISGLRHPSTGAASKTNKHQ